ncbi:MAG: alpha/beta fold hydrolase [Verrucomicrobiae bacterium]
MSWAWAIPVRAALALAVAYLGICLWVFLRQRAMLYCPEPLPEVRMLDSARTQGLSRWADQSGRALGWMTDSGSAIRPVLILQGNAGNALDRGELLAKLQEAGSKSKIYLVDYPGYGSAPGRPDQQSLTSAAIAALDALPEPAIVVGESLGTGVAAQTAARRPEKIRGLILITPFDSMASAASHHYPWLPVGWLLLDRFNSIKALKAFPRPVAIVLGENDTTTPPEGGQRLFESLACPKMLWVVRGANHNDAALCLPAPAWKDLWAFATAAEN